jgi:hypothetical protein
MSAFSILKWKIKCEMSSLPSNTGTEKLLNVAVDVYAPYAVFVNTRIVCQFNIAHMCAQCTLAMHNKIQI